MRYIIIWKPVRFVKYLPPTRHFTKLNDVGAFLKCLGKLRAHKTITEVLICGVLSCVRSYKSCHPHRWNNSICYMSIIMQSLSRTMYRGAMGLRKRAVQRRRNQWSASHGYRTKHFVHLRSCCCARFLRKSRPRLIAFATQLPSSVDRRREPFIRRMNRYKWTPNREWIQACPISLRLKLKP